MSLAADTYGSQLLALLGWDNVFGDAGERYPEVTLEDAAARRPDAVLLPSEPYSFRQRHVPEVKEAIPGVPVVLVDGQDLFWWGIRTPAAVERLAAALSGVGDTMTSLAGTIREQATPCHVPAHVFAVDDIPYTISGKKVEKAVRSMIVGEEVRNRDALANPASLDQYATLPFPG